ncbi:MAG: hypothetical protein KGH98_00205 [Candidatus Micrarchaeota archaeon]|nr:hypothetical protein [Candidatus Micrarchaeota archaeon]
MVKGKRLTPKQRETEEFDRKYSKGFVGDGRRISPDEYLANQLRQGQPQRQTTGGSDIATQSQNTISRIYGSAIDAYIKFLEGLGHHESARTIKIKFGKQSD